MDMVVAPLLHVLRGDVADRLAAVLARGGSVLATSLSGRVDEADNAFLIDVPGPLAPLFGVRVEETDAQPPEVVNPVHLADPDGTGPEGTVDVPAWTAGTDLFTGRWVAAGEVLHLEPADVLVLREDPS